MRETRHWWKEMDYWVSAGKTDGDGSQKDGDNRSAELKGEGSTGQSQDV
jgi:hypothetical protein